MKAKRSSLSLFTALFLITTAYPLSPLAMQNRQTVQYWPTQGWRQASPEEHGMDSGKLADALDYIRQHDIKIHSLTIVRNGYIVLDAYFYPYSETDLHDVASVTKSVTTALVGIAIDQGKIKTVAQPVLQLFPNRPVANVDERKRKLTVQHLVSMSSGLDCTAKSGELTLRRMRQTNDWAQFMLDLPMAAEPGQKFVYCSGGMHLLSAIISQTTGRNELEFARQNLFAPLGIRDAIWPSDSHGVSHGWGDLHLRPRDMAKIGLLWLNRGMWEGRPVVSASWVDESTRVHAKTGNDSEDYGYGWWVKSHDNPFIYEALGRGGQRISVVPSKNMVVVMTGGGFEPGDVGRLLLPAIKSDEALPENQAGRARLAEALAIAKRSPSPSSIPALPETARTVSGKTYLLETNPLGLKKVSLAFTSQPEATLRSTFNDGHLEVRGVGLDGVPRISPGGRYGLPVALKGFWEDEQAFVLDYDEIANINHYQIRLRFSGKRLSVEITERTQDVGAKFGGELEG